MKGATAVPLTRTMRAPNTASIKKMGRSQYFLRIRMKLHSSPMKSIMVSSELPGHRVGRWARRMALDPVRHRIAVKPKPQRILSEQAAHEADGSHGGKEHQAHDYRADAGMEDQSEPEPEAAEGRQHAGKSQSGQQERGGDDQSPAAHRPAPHQGPEGNNREHDRKGESKGPVRRASHHLVADKPLVSFPRLRFQVTYLAASQLRDSHSQSGHAEYKQNGRSKELHFPHFQARRST